MKKAIWNGRKTGTRTKWASLSAVIGAALGLAMVAAMPGEARAAAIIVHSSGNVALGVNDMAELNVYHSEVVPPYPSGGGSVARTGVRGLFVNVPYGYESTAPGCLCEGWGAGLASNNLPGSAGNKVFGGYRNRASGNDNVALVSFASTASTATSVVTIANASGPALRVTHNYHPSASPYLYQADVTITNISDFTLGDTSAGSRQLRYRRVMDWDAEPTAFSEYVTIQGWPADNLLRSDNNGFNSGNPFSFSSYGQYNINFTDVGPSDHGALFDFGFPGLEAEESRRLTIFYGAAPTEALADLARAVVGAEVYSYAHCSSPAYGCSTTAGTPITYIFGFKGVGGTPPPPPPGIPEPATAALMGAGLAGLALAAWRRRKME